MEIRAPHSQEEFERYYHLRWKILREPLGMPLGSEKDEKEDGAYHLAAFLDGQIVGVGRLHRNSAEEGQVRYMAVDPEFRGQQIGSRILESLEQQARADGLERVVLDARDHAIAFYEANGYSKLFSFMHAVGVASTKMEKLLGVANS